MLERTNNETCTHDLTKSAVKLRDGLLYVGVGATIGATLALLFAPKSGTELRSDIADVSRKSYDATVDKATAVKDQTLVAVQSVKDKASAIYDATAAKLSEGEKAVEETVSNASAAVEDGFDKVKDAAKDDSASRMAGRRSASSIM